MSGDWRARLSRIGFGVSGAHGTPLVRPAQTIALIEQAAARGVTLFDTAPAYGNGEAERRLGQALTGLDRDRLVIATKAGLFSHGLSGRRRDFSPDAIEASVTASLARLRVEGVDLVFLHGPDPGELTPALFERLSALQRAGAFTALGVAGRGGELDAALETGRFEALMAPVHPFLDEGEERRLASATGAGLAVFAIETSGDAAAPLRAPRSAADIYTLARKLRPGAIGRGRVAALDGFAAALSRPEVTSALTTTTRPAHLLQSVQCAKYGVSVTGA